MVMRVQSVMRWLKRLLPRGSAAQTPESQTARPRFHIGDRVRVVGSDVNQTARRGEVRDQIWHHKNAAWTYFITENGRKISKRYWESDLESDSDGNPDERSS